MAAAGSGTQPRGRTAAAPELWAAPAVSAPPAPSVLARAGVERCRSTAAGPGGPRPCGGEGYAEPPSVPRRAGGRAGGKEGGLRRRRRWPPGRRAA